MAYDRFLIAPFKTGLETDLKPFLIPEDAMAELNNAYVWRGRIRKRFGGTYLGGSPQSSRFRVNIGTTDGVTGDFSGTAPGSAGYWFLGQQFSIGSYFYTVISDTTGPQTMLRSDGVVATATFDVSNGDVVIDGSLALGSIVWYYPSLPVMGLTNLEEGAINDQPSFGFDTEFAYTYAGSGWTRSVAGTPPVFSGTDSQFFWGANWRGVTTDQTVLFITNFNQPDALWYYSTAVGWTQAVGVDAFYFNPGAGGTLQAGPFVVTCRLIAAFKNRLLLFDTYESDNAMSPTVTQYKNRVRWSHNGSPFAANAWYEQNTFDGSGNVADGGGFLDATTEEEIISLEFIKDRLIVYFERSTWELAYTQNDVQPFVWQKLNTELGSEATFSTVPFDKEILTIGNTGVHSCNGSNVERIDNKIPDQVFEIQDKESGVARVAGVRDYFAEMVYWTFPSTEETSLQKYPNQVLVFNYKNGAWAFNDDCITAFGYFEQQTGLTWENSTTTWEQSEFTWNSGTIQAQFRQVIAGNQQGFTFVVNTEVSINAPVMQITNITYNASSQTATITSLDHTLAVGQYVKLVSVNGVTMSGQGIYQVVSIDASNPALFNIGPVTSFTGTYIGGGFIARASNINILSKQWNPYLNRAQNFYLAKIDFGVEKTVNGAVTVDYYPSASSLSMLEQAADTGALQGTGALSTAPYSPTYYPFEQNQSRLWHPVYFQVEGECIQIRILMSQTQMMNPDISESDFELSGMVLHTQRVSLRLE